MKVFQLAVKQHGVIDQVVGFFPQGLAGESTTEKDLEYALTILALSSDAQTETDKVAVPTLSVLAIWITKLATFHFRQLDQLPGRQGLVIVAPARKLHSRVSRRYKAHALDIAASNDNESSSLSALGSSLYIMLYAFHSADHPSLLRQQPPRTLPEHLSTGLLRRAQVRAPLIVECLTFDFPSVQVHSCILYGIFIRSWYDRSNFVVIYGC